LRNFSYDRINLKILALDIGDQWTGIALSDASRTIAKPFTTVETGNLTSSLEQLFAKEKINEGIIGHPKTMKGTISEQTKKVEEMAALLQQIFPTLTWKLWDERLSSKRAEAAKKNISKEEKLRSHAVAAAFILDSYLGYLHIHENLG